ncbi:MAG: SH3 domain-containing protein [Dehalococcoidia bacterium]
MLAGAAVIAAAALSMALLDFFEVGSTSASPIPVEARATPPGPDADGLAEAYSTSNVRLRPDPSAEVVAIVPAGHAVELLARAPSGEWLRVAYPPASTVQGWVPANRLESAPAEVAALPEAAASSEVSASTSESTTAGPAPRDLPDLVITDVFLLQDGRMSVDIRNEGPGTLIDTAIPLHVTRASGEIVGVLEVGPTTLVAGASATAVTPIVVPSTGTYLLQLDRQDVIHEAVETNNGYSALLVVSRP